MKVWITKYALTSGVRVEEAECSRNTPGLMIVRHPREGIGVDEFFHGLDWHSNREDALARAEQMRVARIASLRMQIAKLEKLSFESVASE